MVRLRDHLLSDAVDLVLSEKLFAEIEEQITETKFAKYFSPEQAESLIDLLRIVGTEYRDPQHRAAICRDPDDDYLLALSKVSKADVLLTGDLDLLSLSEFGHTRIISPKEFLRSYLG